MTFLSSIGAPVVTTDAFSNFSFFAASCTNTGGLALVLDRRVAGQPRDDLRVPVVGEVREQRLADLALVVVQQEVDVLGVVERAVRRPGSR